MKDLNIGDKVSIFVSNVPLTGLVKEVNYPKWNLNWIVIESSKSQEIWIQMDKINFFTLIEDKKEKIINETVKEISTEEDLIKKENQDNDQFKKIDSQDRLKKLIELRKEKRELEISGIKDTLTKKEIEKKDDYYQNPFTMPSNKKRS